MEYSLTGTTYFWLFVPMISLIVLSAITLFTDKGEDV